jgi:hypothetical protein
VVVLSAGALGVVELPGPGGAAQAGERPLVHSVGTSRKPNGIRQVAALPSDACRAMSSGPVRCMQRGCGRSWR